MEERTAEQVVKERWPHAVANHWGGWRDGESGWNVRHCKGGAHLGCGDTEAAAWFDAAQRIQSEGAKHGK